MLLHQRVRGCHRISCVVEVGIPFPPFQSITDPLFGSPLITGAGGKHRLHAGEQSAFIVRHVSQGLIHNGRRFVFSFQMEQS